MHSIWTFNVIKIHSAGEISAILSHLTQQIHVNCFTCVSKPPVQGDRGGRGAIHAALTVIYQVPYRHISPLVRRVLPGILNSLCLPWCSVIGAVRSVPAEREDYGLLSDSWWWISNSTVAPLNRRPTGRTAVKMASPLHPGTLRIRLHPLLRSHANHRNEPHYEIVPTKPSSNTVKSPFNSTIQLFLSRVASFSRIKYK